MATTTHLGITLLETAQAQKEITINEAFARIDAILNTGIIDKDLAVPPTTPLTGDCYIIAASATGDWLGKSGQIAYFDQIWRFIVPNKGLMLWVNDENVHYLFNGTIWQIVVISSGGSGDMTKAVYDGANIAQQVVGVSATQTLTNKTLTAPKFSSIVNTGTLTLPTASDTLIGRATTDTLTNKTLVLPTLTLKQSTNPTPTAEGDIQWDTDDDVIVVGDGTGQKIFSRTQNGTYTPTLSNATNVAASTVYLLSWFRVGNTITVSGIIDIDVTTLGAQTDFDLSLPVASNFALLQDAGGTAMCESANQGFSIQANPTTKTFRFRGIPAASAANVRYGFTANYRVI